MQPTRSGRARVELRVDVAEMGSTDHEDVDPRRAQSLDARPDTARVRPTIRHGGAVPVEHDRRDGRVGEGCEQIVHCVTAEAAGR